MFETNANCRMLYTYLHMYNYRDAFHDTGDGLLHWACDRGNLNMVKLLVKRGADVNIEGTQTIRHLFIMVRDGVFLYRGCLCVNTC